MPEAELSHLSVFSCLCRTYTVTDLDGEKRTERHLPHFAGGAPTFPPLPAQTSQVFANDVPFPPWRLLVPMQVIQVACCV